MRPNKQFNPTCATVRVWYIKSPVGTRELTLASGQVAIVMRNAFEDLARLSPPPSHPVEADGPWELYEAEINCFLPADFKQLIHAYGSGQWGGFLAPVSPFSFPSPSAYREWIDFYLEAERQVRECSPTDFPGPIFPEPGGRLPWAVTDNGDVLWWQTSGPADSWHVIVWGSRVPDHETFEVTSTEFLFRWLTRTLSVSVISDHFLKKAGPSFRSSQHSAICE